MKKNIGIKEAFEKDHFTNPGPGGKWASVSGMLPDSLAEELNSFFHLLRHFILRLFNNDIIKFENQKRESLIVMLTILACIGGVVSVILLMPYVQYMPGFTTGTAWIEKTFFMTISMAFTGIISVINWDNIFLDDRDYCSLSSLPIKSGTMFIAKFVSLLVFVALISLAVNIFSMVAFTVYLEKVPNVNPFYDTTAFGFGWSHLFSGFLGNLFIFLVVALIQMVLMVLFDARRFKKVSMFFQTLLLMGFISVFAWFPRIYGSMEGFKESYASFMYYFPPLWYVGFYEQTIGNYDMVFKQNFYTAAIAVVVLMDLYLLGLPFSFKKFSTPVSREKVTGRFSRVGVFFKRVLDSLLPVRSSRGGQIQKAIFYFTLHTLNRSRRHKLQLAVYIALPLTFVLTHLVILSLTRGADYFKSIDLFMTGIPFVFYIFLTVGFRVVVLHPVSLQSNWIFMVTEDSNPVHYMRGLKKAFLLVGIVPVFLLVFLFYVFSWGFLAALSHSIFALTAALLTMEAAFFTYRKIPFCSVHVPGKTRLRGFWYLYAGGLAAYIYGFSVLGKFLLKHPLYYIAYYGVIILSIAFMRRYRYNHYKDFSFIFDEETEPAMIGLGLDVN
ncbi:MAG: hypothetical protein GY757_05580 [bacterium]|nr:hypothetical protein [bacterium]